MGEGRQPVDDETAHAGEPAPVAPKRADVSDAEHQSPPPQPPAHAPVAEIPQAALSSSDSMSEPRKPERERTVVLEPPVELVSAEPASDRPAEPLSGEPGAADPNDPVATEATDAAAASEPPPAAAPADLATIVEAAPAGVSATSEPRYEPEAQDDPVGGRHPPEPEASPHVEGRFEAGVNLEPSGEGQPLLLLGEPPPADAWATPGPPLPPPVDGVTTPAIGLEGENRAPEVPAAVESLPPAPSSASAPPEPSEAADDPAQWAAPEPPPTEPELQRDEPRQEAQPPRDDALDDAVAAISAAPAQPPPLRHHEPMVPDVQNGAAPSPDIQVQETTSTAPVPTAAWAWIEPVEATPASPMPDAPAPHMPAWVPHPMPPGTAARGSPDLHRALAWVRLALRGAVIAAAALVVTVLALVVLYRWVDPPVSTLMVSRSFAGTEIERTWVPLTRISPHLMRAVILSEDGGFCRHGGVDWGALEEAIESDRGGSTITMQVVKNLFLWPSRSYVRKAIEIGLAYLVEALWSKRRILEIYLNVAEWGDGVFGAEAAAQAHFGKRAARLTAEEAALLAAVLPSPIERTAGAPSLMTSRLASRLLVRMRASQADFSCVPVPRTASRAAPQKSPQQKAPQRTPEKAPLVQGPRMTL
jgi:monofunctional glycosyltransferase